MFDEIKAWLEGSGKPAEGGGDKNRELRLAVAALLVEAAQIDDRFSEDERKVIFRLLERHFALGADQARALFAAASEIAERSAQLFRFTRIINDRLPPERRVEVIEMLWEVAYADGRLDALEDALLRRIGGLIYVPDRERGAARQRVLSRRSGTAAPTEEPSQAAGAPGPSHLPEESTR
ncbi:MAG TPA: TerB family tellurite resistance protein [Stellaceae bacterium]|nr:TerB family tellurite resistance protein [Stellaceae bacterium]